MDSSLETQKIKEGFIGQKMITIPPNIRKEIVANSLISDFYLTAIGYYPHAIHHDRKRKFGCKEYIWLYCTEGSGEVVINNKNFELIPNTYIIIPPGISHHYKSSEKQPWTIYWAHFFGEKSDILYSRYLDEVKMHVGKIPLNESRLKKMIEMIDTLENNFESKNIEITNINFYHLLSSIIYHIEPSPSFLNTDPISQSITFLNKHIKEIFKVEDLALQQNLSVSRYTELFKKKTGFSPIKYFNNIKIQKSCQYLYFTDLTIKEISLKVGFKDQYYFSRAFSKLIGMPPSKYKMLYENQYLRNKL
ncbi:AraC family transcriptional regulator [Wocania ichthyoenteri]|uniref:AraC family transcriptional regulator n=1 Tax=Wocania ichthyoenteri TaxID=1230531 RepID=UPI00053E15A4|nr:AraC family transcriptional regulator [Wocania ichthyoenteri]